MKIYKLKNLSIVLTTLITLFIYSDINSTIRYVSKTGNSTPPYLTWETAADSIQECINICVFGDTIYVADGVYQEQVVMIPGLSLIGAGMDSCIVDARPVNVLYAVTVADNCLLKGFKIIATNTTNMRCVNVSANNSLITLNHITTASQGIYCENANSVIYKNVFDQLRTRGISINNSSCLVAKNYIYINTTSLAEAIFIQASTSNYKPIVDSNYIETNRDGIYKNPGTRPTIRNNEIRLINGIEGIFLHSFQSDSAWVYNNIIYAETGIIGIENIGVPYLQLYNNYATGNFDDQQNLRYVFEIGSYNRIKNNVVTNAERGVEAWGTQGLEFRYNNVWNNAINYSGFTPDTTNLSVDPMIVNDDTTQGDLDFHLQMFSPLIDAGDPSILDKDSSRSDIGLYGGPYGESYTYVDLPPRSPVNLTVAIDSLIKLRWNKNTEADFNHYNFYRDTTSNFQIDSTKLVASVTDTFYNHIIPAGIESLYFKITGVDNQGNESNPSEEVGVLITSVEDEWKPLNNYILYQNYPNPFNPSTTISYKLKERGYVKLYVYDIKGELVSVLVNQTQEAGYYEVEFSAKSGSASGGNANELASGVYIYQIFVQGENNIPVFSDIKKMVYVK